MLFEEIQTQVCGCKSPGFQDCWAAGERVGEQAKLKCPSTVLTEVQQFRLDKCSLDCCNPSINFQSSEKGDLGNFATIFIASLEKQIYRGSHSAILKVLPSSNKSWFLKQTKSLS